MSLTPQITLHGTLQDLFGAADANASLLVTLCGYGSQVPRINGTSMLAKIAPQKILGAVDGSFNFALWGNDVITPSGTFYTVQFMDDAGNLVQTQAYQFTGTSNVDLSTVAPFNPPQIPPTVANPVLLNAPGVQTIQNGLQVNGTFSTSSLTLNQLITKDPYFDVRWFGAKCDGVTDDTTAVQDAINTAQGLYPAIPTIYFPPGTTRLRSVSYSTGNILFVGDGTGLCKIQHIDGDANPLFHNTAIATGSPAPAYAHGGFVGISFVGGSLTTALIYVDGQIDNQMLYYDLQFLGQSANSTMDAISVKDYLNWSIRKVRFDGIGGWAINVRGNSIVFNEGHLLVDDFSYDNSTGSTAWGNGLFFMDAATGTPLSTYKGPILFSNARIEINRPLNGAASSRGLIRILQDQTTWAASAGPLIQVGLKSIGMDANGADTTIVQGKDMKVVSVSAGDIALSVDDMGVFGVTEFYGNDAGTHKWHLPIVNFNQSTRILSARTPGHQSISVTGIVNTLENHFGSDHYWIETDGNKNFLYPLRRGDVAWMRDPLNDASHAGRAFAYKAVQSTSGYHYGNPAGNTLAVTGTMTAGSNLLTLSGAVPGSVIEQANVTVAGAGAAGADLLAVVTAINFTTNVVTLGDGSGGVVNAGTSVAAATVKITPAVFFAVDMVQYGTAAPTTGTYQRGDKVLNTAIAASGGTLMWVCTTAGTPGTWAAMPLADGATGTGKAVLNISPTITGNTFTNDNAADANLTHNLSSGSTAGFFVSLTWQDRGVSKWKWEKTTGNLFQCTDSADSSSERILFASAAQTRISSRGTSAIQFNNPTNSGTGGVEFWSGGATPAKVASVDTNGKAIVNGGVQCGSAGSTINTSLSGSASLTYTSIAAQTSQEQTLTVTGATAGKAVFASPASDIGANLCWSARVSATNTVAVRVTNPTTGAVTPTAVAWNVWVLQ